jgi:Cft2 family RNA processing exonuclease
MYTYFRETIRMEKRIKYYQQHPEEVGIENLDSKDSGSIENEIKRRISVMRKNIHFIQRKKIYGLGANVKIKFYRAGHMSGARMVMVCTPWKNILYTGDISLEERRSVKAMEIPEEPVDIVICDSTYGGRCAILSQEEKEKLLAEIINKTQAQGGKVLIPVLAQERASELLVVINHLKEKGLIPAEMPVYVDGRAKVMIRSELHGSVRDEIPGATRKKISSLRQSVVYIGNHSQREACLARNKSGIILASAGMVHRISRAKWWADRLLGNKANAVVMVSFQAPGTPGHSLLKYVRHTVSQNGLENASGSGDSVDQIFIDDAGKEILVKAGVYFIPFSSHIPHQHIVEFIEKINPGTLFLVHGEKEARKAVADEMRGSEQFRGEIGSLSVGGLVEIMFDDDQGKVKRWEFFSQLEVTDQGPMTFDEIFAQRRERRCSQTARDRERFVAHKKASGSVKKEHDRPGAQNHRNFGWKAGIGQIRKSEKDSSSIVQTEAG